MNREVAVMHIEGPEQQPVASEFEVLTQLLPLAGARVLELGCGAAEKTRQIAERSNVAAIVAAEVDQIQHGKNLLVADLPKVTFKAYGAESIAEADDSFDIVVMFKSLHHVPMPLMDAALAEIRRVLRPGGLAYISEPVFAGDFNEILRLFHDESQVRRAAFAAVERAVSGGLMTLVEQRFFRNVIKLTSFAQFEQGVLNVTHTDHQVTPQLLEQVRAKFESFRSEAGYRFEAPNRVELLRKPS
ncbi:MAG: methyltransferase domain-containing protein [Pseudomonadales bacterium]